MRKPPILGAPQCGAARQIFTFIFNWAAPPPPLKYAPFVRATSTTPRVSACMAAACVGLGSAGCAEGRGAPDPVDESAVVAPATNPEDSGVHLIRLEDSTEPREAARPHVFVVDLGSVQPGDISSGLIRIANSTVSTVDLSRPAVSCGCLSASGPVLEPTQVGDLRYSIRVADAGAAAGGVDAWIVSPERAWTIRLVWQLAPVPVLVGEQSVTGDGVSATIRLFGLVPSGRATADPTTSFKVQYLDDFSRWQTIPARITADPGWSASAGPSESVWRWTVHAKWADLGNPATASRESDRPINDTVRVRVEADGWSGTRPILVRRPRSEPTATWQSGKSPT